MDNQIKHQFLKERIDRFMSFQHVLDIIQRGEFNDTMDKVIYPYVARLPWWGQDEAIEYIETPSGMESLLWVQDNNIHVSLNDTQILSNEWEIWSVNQ